MWVSTECRNKQRSKCRILLRFVVSSATASTVPTPKALSSKFLLTSDLINDNCEVFLQEIYKIVCIICYLGIFVLKFQYLIVIQKHLYLVSKIMNLVWNEGGGVLKSRTNIWHSDLGFSSCDLCWEELNCVICEL